MTCENARIKINGLIDNELDEQEIDSLISHLAQCSDCRNYYKELLKLNRQMKRINLPDPADNWYINFRSRFLRKSSGFIGRLFFIGSYLALLIYSLFTLFKSSNEDLWLKLIIGGIFLGFFILLAVSIADRIKESKNDKYKGVIR